LIGNVDQLPSVGPVNVLGDIIDSETVPVVRRRWAKGESNFYFLGRTEPEEIRHFVI
jgi:ATP-dependent exoDNAse (exonuclease V) alpha subunit